MSIYKNREIVSYGLALALLLFLMQWLQYKFLLLNNATDIYVGIIALFFTILGFWLALKITKPKVKEIIVEKEVIVNNPMIDEKKITELGLSSRELEILTLLARGMSNKEIGNALFISLSTVKTHTSNVFGKLNVKRRTQAIEIARQLNLIK